MGFFKDILKETAEAMNKSSWRPDERKFCWRCMEWQEHKWEDSGSIFTPIKWRCKVCGRTKRASLWEICR